MKKISDHEISIRKSAKKKAKCSVCGYRSQETYLIHRHGNRCCLCRKCTRLLLLMAALME